LKKRASSKCSYIKPLTYVKIIIKTSLQKTILIYFRLIRTFTNCACAKFSYIKFCSNFMKQVILSFVAIFAFVAVSFAQTPAVPAATATPAATSAATNAPAQKDKAPRMGNRDGQRGGGLKDLGLTADQETAFKAANQAHQAKVQAIMADKTIAVDAKKTQIDNLKAEYSANVQGILNADQFAKWSQKRADRAENKMEKRAERMEKRADGEMKHDDDNDDHKGKMGKMGKKMRDAANDAAPATKPN
jgi:Spy/CpxP family protein refolding chaperone